MCFGTAFFVSFGFFTKFFVVLGMEWVDSLLANLPFSLYVLTASFDDKLSSRACAKHWSNSFVFSGSCPATILDGFTVNVFPVVEPVILFTDFSRYVYIQIMTKLGVGINT